MATAVRDEKGRFTRNANNGNGGRHYGLIAGAAAGGAALGLLAMMGRKAAVIAPTVLAGNWADALAAEHKAVLKIFDALDATEDGATARRTMLLMQLRHALAKHAIEEENVIYPALREAGEQDAADALTRDHGYVKQYLYDLDTMPASAPGWMERLRAFRTDLERHMREEEDVLFPALRARLTDEKNKALTHAMNREGFKLA